MRTAPASEKLLGEPPAATRLLALLGLACRAGRLAVGITAVQQQVAAGRRPLIVVARGAGKTLRRRIGSLAPVRGIWWDCLDRRELAAALGRRELVVVGVADPAFVRGLIGSSDGEEDVRRGTTATDA